MTLTDLLQNIDTMARQAPGRIRALRDGFGLVGSGAEQFDSAISNHRLPTVLEFMSKVLIGIGKPTKSRAYYTRRELTPEEARQLFRAASASIRKVRKEHPAYL